MNKDYPDWICSPCGHKHGKRLPRLATYHNGECDWCKATDVPVTEPRDFGYPDAPKEKRVRGKGRKPAMRHVTLRMPEHVVDYYGGDIKKMRDAWVSYVEGKITLID